MADPQQHPAPYVQWFRNSAPYINAHRGRTFVVHFGGEAIESGAFATLIHDFTLLDSLGIRLVLVHGARAQIDARLAAAGLDATFSEGVRVTSAQALGRVVEANAAARVRVETLLSMGLPNSPMAGAKIRVSSGNFLVARPLGVRRGVDFGHSGELRRVDTEAIRSHLDQGSIVLISPIGYSPTGEVFNLHAEEVAREVAVQLSAAKLVYLCEGTPLADAAQSPLRELTVDEAEALLGRRRSAPREASGTRLLAGAVRACRNGVKRVHLLDRGTDGALLLELFTRDGVGAMVSADAYDATRRATLADIGGVLELIAPLQAEGWLAERSRENLESEMDRYIVVERDGAIIGCAALFTYPDSDMAELACLAVDESYRNAGRGDVLLEAIEREARDTGASRLFALTTRASHWFKERGFRDGRVEELPPPRRHAYDPTRRSKVMFKSLTGNRDADVRSAAAPAPVS